MAFRFDWVHKNDGFDPNPDTPFLMVPQNEFKEVKLPGLNNNIANFTWKCSPSDALGWGASGGDKLFVFAGTKTGLFRLEARNSAGEVAKLDVSVKRRHTYVIQAFNHAGRHHATRSFTSLMLLVREANSVLKPQTNQQFMLIPEILSLKTGESFGPVITDREHMELSIEATQACWDKNVIPLVLVKELEFRSSPSPDDEGATWNDAITIEDDIAMKKTYALAHELGHFFSLNHISNKNGLMYASSPRGSKLHKRECNTMNQTGLF